MELVAHGSYKTEIQGNVLFVEAVGPFNDVILDSFHQDMIKTCQHLHGSPWASIAIYHGNGIFTPEAELLLTETNKFRVKQGMVANAAVFLNSNHADLQQMQLNRIYQAAGIPFHTFSNKNSAKEWINAFLAQRCPAQSAPKSAFTDSEPFIFSQ